MSDALELVKAILAEDDPQDHAALALLDAALESELDVLHYCAVALGMAPATIMERAAAWAGYSFFDHVPLGLAGNLVPTRLEALATVRMFRQQLLDREIAFTAPEFFDVIRLKHRLATTPHLRQLLCLIPEPALRDYLTRAAAPALMDAARQNLARHWPYASAHIELTGAARYGFVLALLLLVVMVLAAPHVAQVLLLPVTLILLLAPAAVRLAAALEPLPPQPRLSRPPDEELPVYSVLIPLRNEAAMVPQLFAAMLALDYPALWSKRTKAWMASHEAGGFGLGASPLRDGPFGLGIWSRPVENH